MNADDYREAASNSDSWVNSGLDLLASADLLWPEVEKGFQLWHEWSAAARTLGPDGRLNVDYDALRRHTRHGGAFLLLAGYAIENLLKAVRVRRRVIAGEPITEDNRLVGVPTDHAYATFARIELGTLSVIETDVLNRLSRAVIWTGRYPIDKRADRTDWFWQGFVSSDYDQIHRIATRLVELHKTLPSHRLNPSSS